MEDRALREATCSPSPTGEAPSRHAPHAERVLASIDVPLALLIAPAGSGRTSTVLRQWMARDERRFAWAVLADALAVAMGWGPSGDLGVGDVEGWTETETDALCLAQLALLAIEQGDWHGGALLIARASRQLETPGAASPAAALVLAVAAAADAHRGRVEEAARGAEQSMRLLAAAHGLPAWYEVETRIALARAALRLSDVLQTRRLLAEASRLLRRRDASTHVLRQRLDELWAQADAVASSAIGGGWSLTTAELRVLQLLPTHLSFPDIARRLFVSPNTVKTHARAVYRKLDASSRAEAVLQARAAGLLDVAIEAA